MQFQFAGIRAIYEGGVFRPVEAVDLPDSTSVELQISEAAKKIPSLDDVYAILGKRFNSGEGNLAERHNEHQP